MRVRGFTQDDGHIFCTEDQILKECMDFTRIVRDVYHTFGFEDILYKVATRPEMRIGEDAVWDKAEAALIESLDACGLPVKVPSTARRLSITSRIASAEPGSAVRFRSTSRCRDVWVPNMLPKTIHARCL